MSKKAIFTLITVGVLICVAVIVLINDVQNTVELPEPIRFGNRISNINNYGFVTQNGEYIFYLQQAEKENMPAGLYRAKTNGTEKTLLSEKEGGISMSWEIGFTFQL